MNPIAIGVAAPLSGDSARIGTEMRRAAELAVDEMNACGGILGTAVALRVADDAGDVERGVSSAREFCSQPDVLGIVGHLNSDVSLAASHVYAHDGLAMITPIASNPALTERGMGNVFRFTNRDDATARAIATHLHDALGKRCGVVVESDTMYGRSMAGCFVEAFGERGGGILLRQTIATGERDFRELLDRLPQDFDFLFYGGMFEGAPILRAMRDAGLEQLFASGDGCWDAIGFLEPTGAAATTGEGVLVLSASPEIGRVPGAREFAERYAHRHGPITNYAVNSYDTTRFLLLAIEVAAKATSRTQPSRTEMIDAIRRIAFRGIAYADSVEWDAKGDNLAAVTALHVIQNGAFHQVAEFDRHNHIVFETATSRMDAHG
jgi:branched-chain amino acid transport system substrate-binding protein